MLSVTFTPGSRTAFERTMRSRASSATFGESKYFRFGQMRIEVPVFFSPTLPVFFSFFATLPSSNAIWWTPPSRLISTSSFSDSALVTDMPTPCRPPENL
jgi:hypothetical protein